MIKKYIYTATSLFDGALMVRIKGEAITFRKNDKKSFELSDDEFKNINYSKDLLKFEKEDKKTETKEVKESKSESKTENGMKEIEETKTESVKKKEVKEVKKTEAKTKAEPKKRTSRTKSVKIETEEK